MSLEDFRAGVRVVLDKWYTYRDVTVPVDRALVITVREAEARAENTDMQRFSHALTTPPNDYLGPNIMGVNLLDNLTWFYHKVKRGANWDIKEEKPWNTTINVAYPGLRTTVAYDGKPIALGDLGNFTYGYIGAALELELITLVGGSVFAAMLNALNGSGEMAGVPISIQARNEWDDWTYIEMGFNAYKYHRF